MIPTIIIMMMISINMIIITAEIDNTKITEENYDNYNNNSDDDNSKIYVWCS